MSQTTTQGGQETPIVTTFFGLIRLSPEKAREKLSKKRAKEDKKLKEAEVQSIKQRIESFHKAKSHTNLHWLPQEYTDFQAAWAEIDRKKSDIDAQLVAAREAARQAQAAQRGAQGRAGLIQQVTTLAQRLGPIRVDEALKREVRDLGSSLVERIRTAPSSGALAGDVKALLEQIIMLEEEARRVASLDPMTATRELRMNVQRDVNNHRDKLWKQAVATCTDAVTKAGQEPPPRMAAILYAPLELVSVNYNKDIVRESDAKKLEKFRKDGMGALDKAHEKLIKDYGGRSGAAKLITEVNRSNQQRDLELERTRRISTLDEQWRAVTDALATLRDAGSDTAAEWEKKCDEVYDGIIAKEGFQTAPAEIEGLVKRIGMATQIARQEADRLRTAFLRRADDQAKIIQRTIAVSSDPIAAKLKTEMESEIEAVKALAGATNSKSFQAAVGLLDKLIADWTGTGAAATALTNFTTTVTQINDIITAKAIAADFGERCGAITEQLAALRERATVPKMTATAAGALMLLANAEKIQRDADALAAWRLAMPERLRKLEERITAIRQDLPPSRSETKTGFELVVRDIRAAYALPGADMAVLDKKLYDAEIGVQEIVILARGGPDSKMDGLLKLNEAADTGEKQLQDEANDLKAQQESLEFLAKVRKELEKQFGEVSSAVKNTPNGDKQELGEIEALMKQLKTAQKAKELEDSKRLVDSITRRLNALEKFPGGGRMESADELRKIRTLWQDAKGKLESALGKLVENAGPAAQTASPAVDIERPITGFGARFNADVLIDATLTVADERGDLKARKAAREVALREVRAMRRLIEGDAMATMIGVNPFKVSKPLHPIKVFLDGVELNVLRAVPTE